MSMVVSPYTQMDTYPDETLEQKGCKNHVLYICSMWIEETNQVRYLGKFDLPRTYK